MIVAGAPARASDAHPAAGAQALAIIVPRTLVMNRTIAAVGLGVVVAAMGMAPTPQKARPTATHVIDLLTRVDAEEGQVPEADRLMPPFGRRGGPVSHTPPPPERLSLQLISFDRQMYEIGDPLIYELLVTNKGQTPVPFPTSPDRSRFSRSTADAVGAFVHLELNDPMFGLQVVGTQVLLGAPTVPDSTLVLRPGESVEIRAKGVWYLMGGYPQTPPPTWTRDLKVRGAVHLFSQSDPQESPKSEPLQIRLRKE